MSECNAIFLYLRVHDPSPHQKGAAVGVTYYMLRFHSNSVSGDLEGQELRIKYRLVDILTTTWVRRGAPTYMLRFHSKSVSVGFGGQGLRF